MSSTGGPKGHAMLPRVRAVLLRLQFEGHPDLAEVDVRKMGNYWLKVTGDSLMLDGGIPHPGAHGQRARQVAPTRQRPAGDGLQVPAVGPRDEAQDVESVIRFLAASVDPTLIVIGGGRCR